MQTKLQSWAGWALTILPSLLLLFSAVMKFMGGPDLAKGFDHLGLPINLAYPLGILELTVTLLCLIPQTAVLGAVLMAGYMGGAILTHLRVGDPWFIQVLLGMAMWGGIWLREPRLWKLLPFRR